MSAPLTERKPMFDMNDDWRGESLIRSPKLEKNTPTRPPSKPKDIELRRVRIAKLAREGKTIAQICEIEKISRTRVNVDLRVMGARAVDTRLRAGKKK